MGGKFTGALIEESPKVLRRVLSECFLLGISRKYPGECPRECLQNCESPRECSRECFSLGKNEERHSWKHSLGHFRFSGRSLGQLSANPQQKALQKHSPEYFRGLPNEHSCKWQVGSQKASFLPENAKVGIIERGVSQAYVRARASSATLCSVHVVRVFLCISNQKGNLICIKTGLDTHLIRIQTRTPMSRYPPYDYSNKKEDSFTFKGGS